MDVSNLIPAQNSPAPAKPATARTRPDASPVPAKAIAAAAAAGASTPRPAAPTGPISDRIERSADLDRRVAELNVELRRTSQESSDHVAEVTRALREAKDASHETLVRAAAGILHGELFFMKS
jgi:transposase